MKEKTTDNKQTNKQVHTFIHTYIHTCLADLVKRFRFYSNCNRKSFEGFEQGSCVITLDIDYTEAGKCRSLGGFEIIQVRND